jgi:hypothetical protein
VSKHRVTNKDHVTNADIVECAEAIELINKWAEEYFEEWQASGFKRPVDSNGERIMHNDPMKDGFHQGFFVGLACAGVRLKNDGAAMWRLKTYFEDDEDL